ncbi:MAG: carboxypeptidase regulatory-like domain-containing protein [Planctomycetes bacterium]|nr:carboxypeptidase regulatory-like domain-containing protein [Planctomycetota bacterium]
MRWLLLLVLALGTGLAGLWWLGSAEPPPPADPDTTPTATSRPDPANPAAGGPRWDDAAAQDATSDATGSATDAEDDRTTAAEPGTASPRRALVVRGDPPQPVADAEVLFVDEADRADRLSGQTPPPREQWPELWGQRVRTDADGIAPLPAAPGTLLVAARADGEFAFAVLQHRRDSVTLLLQPDESLELHVRRTDDRPAEGVPVCVLQALGKDEPHRACTGTSDAAGKVVIPHFQLHRRAADPAVERFAALAQLPGPVPVCVEFDGRPAPREPVVLRLPALASIELVVTDHRGTPLLSPAWVAVKSSAAVDTSLPFQYGANLLLRHAPKPPGAQSIRLEPVAGGAELQASVHFANDRRGIAIGVRTPPGDGANVRVELPLSERQVLLAGRCLRADGTPFGPGRLRASVWHGERDLAVVDVFTLRDGRFDVVLARRDEAPPFRLHLRVAPADGEPAAPLGASCSLPELAHGRRIELGDLVLGELPPLVGGVVLDDLGAPIVGAEVQVQAHRPERRRGDPWPGLPDLDGRTDDAGRFALHGDLPPGELRLRAGSPRHFAAVQPLHTGGQQMELRLERIGVVHGRALLPEWLADEAVTLRLQPFDEALREQQSVSVPLRRRRGGRFTVQPLHAGRYDAVLTVRNVAEPIVVVGDVFVQPGDNRDPRLQELDLRQALFRYRLRAVDAAGRPVAFEGPIQARLALPDGTTAEAGFRWQKGRAELITPSPQAELLFFGRGFAPQQRTFGPGDHDVFLTALRPALLELPGARALCGPERRVRVSAILTEPTGYPESLGGIDQTTGERFAFARWDLGRSSGAWLERYDTVEVPLMRSGRYEVVLRVHATDERSPQASVSLGVHELQVDAASLLPVRIAVDAAAVQEACNNVDASHRAAAEQRARR